MFVMLITTIMNVINEHRLLQYFHLKLIDYE